MQFVLPPQKKYLTYGKNIIGIRGIPYNHNSTLRLADMILFFLKSLISKKIYEVNPSLIIADSVHPLGALTGLWFSIVKKCPFVYQIRDIWPLALVTEGKLSKINPIYWLFEIIQNICLKKCAFVLSSLKYYNKFLKEKKVFKKVVWIPNPIKKTNYKKQIVNKYQNLLSLYIGS